MAQQTAQVDDGHRNGGKSKNAFRTISEVASELDVPQHVLRFWETKFSQVRPMKRGGNRRYYRPEDIELLSAIRHFLYTDGYTIKGVQKLIKGKGVRAFIDGWNEEKGLTRPMSESASAESEQAAPVRSADKALLKAVIDELKSLRSSLNKLGE